jgi:hypothetical protein
MRASDAADILGRPRASARGGRPLNASVRHRMSHWRAGPSTSQPNTGLRMVALVLGVIVVAANANRYLELDWFGSYGRLISAVANLVGIVFVIFGLRLWRQ